MGEITDRLGPEDAIRHVTRKHLNNRFESDHAALKGLLRPMRGFRDLASAKATLKGIETFRAITKAEFDGPTKGVASEVAFVENLFKLPAC
jgi:IS6 family transposase